MVERVVVRVELAARRERREPGLRIGRVTRAIERAIDRLALPCVGEDRGLLSFDVRQHRGALPRLEQRRERHLEALALPRPRRVQLRQQPRDGVLGRAAEEVRVGRGAHALVERHVHLRHELRVDLLEAIAVRRRQRLEEPERGVRGFGGQRRAHQVERVGAIGLRATRTEHTAYALRVCVPLLVERQPREQRRDGAVIERMHDRVEAGHLAQPLQRVDERARLDGLADRGSQRADLGRRCGDRRGLGPIVFDLEPRVFIRALRAYRLLFVGERRLRLGRQRVPEQRRGRPPRGQGCAKGLLGGRQRRHERARFAQVVERDVGHHHDPHHRPQLVAELGQQRRDDLRDERRVTRLELGQQRVQDLAAGPPQPQLTQRRDLRRDALGPRLDLARRHVALHRLQVRRALGERHAPRRRFERPRRAA